MNSRLQFSFIISVLLALCCINTLHAQCTDPSPSVLKITNDSVTLIWPAVTNATGYEYVVQTSGMPQPTSGTPTTATTVGVGGLPYTAHTAWVRTDCNGTFSNWASISFTIVCSTPGTVAINNITDSSATISWAQVGNITSYEYVLNNFVTDPPGPGTPHTTTSYNATGLLGGTDYYMHIRTDCGGGKFSDWQTESFTTQFPAGISTTYTGGSIQVYPNPTTGMISIDGLTAGNNNKLVLMNTMGTVLYQANVTGNTEKLDMSGYAPGIYILQYFDGTAYSIMRVSRL